MYSKPVKLIDNVRHKIRIKHYSIRTEEAYVSWIKRYIFYHHKRHPKDMGKKEIEAFLSHLAIGTRKKIITQSCLSFGPYSVLHQRAHISICTL